MLFRILLAASWWLAAPIPASASDAAMPSVAVAVKAELSSRTAAMPPPRADRLKKAQRIYAESGFEPRWFAPSLPHLPSAQAAQLLERLRASAAKGLDPAAHPLSRLERGLVDAAAGRLGSDAVARLDIDLTVASIRYLGELATGRVDPVSVQFDIGRTGREDRIAFAVAAAVSDGVAAAESAVEPSFAVYRRMLSLLARYREMAADPRFTAMLPSPARRPGVAEGDTYAGSFALATRLRLLGDLPDAAPALAPESAPVYDTQLAAAVRRFQARHGLQVDGVLGERTLAELNLPVAARVRQVELAIERIRWLPEPGPGPFVAVNIPDFRLWAVDRGSTRLPLSMRVIVGRAGTRSEVFADTIRAVEVNPYWNVPRSIAVKELYPKLARDPGWLERERMELIGAAGLSGTALRDALASGRARLRQRPGPENALGRFKFVMPNRYSIYLHDTPSRVLFERSRRDFSHGCIRLEAPNELAQFLLEGDTRWSREAIAAAVETGANRTIPLRRPIPVLIFYSTVHVDADGSVRFVPDIYGHDARLDAALARAGAT
jgi:L,D-transpeptidase YcbB